MSQVSVRYIVEGMDEAIGFYCEQLGFDVDMHPAPTFAMLSRGDLRLLLSEPSAEPGGARSRPTAGGPSRAAGTGSPSRSPTSPQRPSACAPPGSGSGRRSSRAPAGTRS